MTSTMRIPITASAVCLLLGTSLTLHGCTSSKDDTTLADSEESLVSCLLERVSKVLRQEDGAYNAATHCKNARTDIVPRPLAVVIAANESDVQEAVRCAAKHKTQVCARAGGHGFENYAGCSEGILVDVQDLQSFKVSDSTQVVSFGSGHTLGQLYYKLGTDGKNLTVPGGVVSGVGAAGLFLGCGRGALTQMYGLACDSILGVTYVDAEGNLQSADSENQPDMYWMARGSGGEFPGIVTEFKVQAYAVPREISKTTCVVKGLNEVAKATKGKAMLQSWWPEAEEFMQPGRKTFSYIMLWNHGDLSLANSCIDCTTEEKAWLQAKVDRIASAGNATCEVHNYSWFDFLLHESGVKEGMIEKSHTALLNRSQSWGAWTKADGSPAGQLAQRNGGMMLNKFEISGALIDTVFDWMVNRTSHLDAWEVFLLLYPLGGPRIENVGANDTPYGNRNSKYVFHTKHQYDHTSASKEEVISLHHDGMYSALSDHLSCQGFYNYMDKGNLPCAKTKREWLDAYFSDVPRMLDIKAAQDPRGVFRSRL